MQQQVVLVIVIVSFLNSCASGATSADYPKFVHVFSDPRITTELYDARKGPVNESLVFNGNIKLTSVVVPTQVIPYAGGVTYDEDIYVRVYNYWNSKPVAEGRFRGKVRYLNMVHVPIIAISATPAERVPPKVSGRHTFSFFFRKAGSYSLNVRQTGVTDGAPYQTVERKGYLIGISYMRV